MKADTMFAAFADKELAATQSKFSARIVDDEWRAILPAPVPPPHNNPNHPIHGCASRVWVYRDEVGATMFLVCRFDKSDGTKEFCPLTYGNLAGRAAWHWKAPLALRPLYGLDRLAKRPNAPVIVCEGEKSADAAERLFPEFVAVTSPNGAKAADKADWTPLAARHVTIWPDHDPEGERYAADVADLARNAGAARIAIVAVPLECPTKWDLADPLPEGWTVEHLRQLLDTAVPASSIDSGSQFDRIGAELRRLASLSAFDYQLSRKDAAKALNIRVTALDDEVGRRRSDASESQGQGRRLELPTPEPWPEAVDGIVLLDELAATFLRYLALPDGAAHALALWVMHTHVYDISLITPRLAIISPTMGCGKTTLLGVLAALVARPLQAANVSPAAIFRTVESAKPTLLIDEADSFMSGNEELRGILNSGHRSDGAVIRLVGDDHEPRQFATFAPAAIACIGKLPATLMDRSLVIEMRRRRPDETVVELIGGRPQGADRMARQCVRWTKDYRIRLDNAMPFMPALLRNRAADNWRPLLAIAEAAGGNWPERARAAARLLSPDDSSDDNSAGIMLLADLKIMFGGASTDRLASETICATLATMENRPWPEWWHGKPITTRQLAKLLKPFKIVPGTIRLADGKTPKGYHLAAFTDAFARYLSADPPQRHNSDSIGISRDSSDATSESLWRIESAQKPNDGGHCGAVADRKGEIDAGEIEEALWTA